MFRVKLGTSPRVDPPTFEDCTLKFQSMYGSRRSKPGCSGTAVFHVIFGTSPRGDSLILGACVLGLQPMYGSPRWKPGCSGAALFRAMLGTSPWGDPSSRECCSSWIGAACCGFCGGYWQIQLLPSTPLESCEVPGVEMSEGVFGPDPSWFVTLYRPSLPLLAELLLAAPRPPFSRYPTCAGGP